MEKASFDREVKKELLEQKAIRIRRKATGKRKRNGKKTCRKGDEKKKKKHLERELEAKLQSSWLHN